MSFPTTVVISAAGRGSRLGLGRNKALVEVGGKPLIRWQLELLPTDTPVVIGLGYQSEQVKAEALAVRSDLAFAMNHDYGTTGAAATLLGGAALAPGRVLSLPADLIVHPDDLLTMLSCTVDTAGILLATSVDPVSVKTSQIGVHLVVIGGLRDAARDGQGMYEWSGAVNYDPLTTRLGHSQGHVFEYVTPGFPMVAQIIRARELDFVEELPAMVNWLRNLVRLSTNQPRNAAALGKAKVRTS